MTAARLLGRTGNPNRFPTASAFAQYAGTAPIEIASADRARHRLSRRGDRQLNAALHTVAITQIRMPGSRGHAYYQAELAEGKTSREAQRCLKRRLADHVWRTMVVDERRRALLTRAREEDWGRLQNPARPVQPRRPTLRTSHFPDSP
ncbi:IS110 family transposase [Streptomyces sp. JV185]|uniref:IS110 family transposase n=1 Tax=Streptomyces sp. JV185 TaxID=858638 RepID=UPI002E7A485A|nr:IS110 family transposase [Streptomyces sp. JV185]MEE1768876.1 IS110 family transposase [Streptomyces sp. JV185]